MDVKKYMQEIGRKGGLKRGVKKGFACPHVQAKAQKTRRENAAKQRKEG